MDILDFDVFDLADRILDSYPEPVPFEDFGPYRIVRPLGRGGMGEVFLAEDQTAGRRVAVKFVRLISSGLMSPGTGLAERFTREIKTLAKLEHPFIARLYDVGVHPNGTPYFAMEYVEGKPLDEYCRDHACSAQQRMHLFRSVCEAVQYAHTHLIVHRDLKPSNILINEDGTPKLLDFGIAKQLENPDEPSRQTETELRFTRAFAAPEQLRGEIVGVYSDVYALGVILYELLAGRPPYPLENCTPVEAELIITGPQEPDKPSASAKRAPAEKGAWNDLDVLCLKAMKKDVSRRYHSVVELTQDVDHYLKGEPLMARPDTLRYRLGKFIKRNRRMVTAGALVFTLIVGLVSFFTLRLKMERDYANRETAIATVINRFLTDDLLGRTDPFKSGKAQESFADVVNRASSQIDAQFRTEPAIAARLHETIAKAFDNRSDFARARQEYDRANRLFQIAEGPSSQDAIAVRLHWAAMEAMSNEPGSLKAAQSLLNSTNASLPETARPRDDISVLLPYARGAIAIVTNDAHSANMNFAEALRRAQAAPSLDKIEWMRMKEMVAFSYVRLDEGAKAEPLFREVVEDFSRSYGSSSLEVLRVRAYLAQALMRQGRYADSIKETNLIYPILVTKLGADHRVSMAVLGTRAAAEGYAGMLDEAARDDLILYRIAVARPGPISDLTVESLSDAALSQCRAGHYAEGELNARKAFSESTHAFGPRAGVTGGTADALATCLIGMNKLDEASDLLRNIDADAVAQLSGDSTVAATIALAQGQIAAKKGNYVLARHYVQIAAPTFERPNADKFDKQTLEKLKQTIDSHRP
ncbi:MAG TPA: serine/threonine-protein kinase [Bryobacteraceae bacterium]|jgi:serine/threonine-protein kinase|nr:serine/threonine-protein kinase [Bryobacteraceae bacterium]